MGQGALVQYLEAPCQGGEPCFDKIRCVNNSCLYALQRVQNVNLWRDYALRRGDMVKALTGARRLHRV